MRLRPLHNLGTLVDSTSASVPIVRATPLPTSRPAVGSDEGDSGEEAAAAAASIARRLAPETVAGRNAAPRQAVLPDSLSKRLSRLTLDAGSPQALRQRVAGMYGAMQSGSRPVPALERADVDAHIAALFLQDWAALHHALAEVRKRDPAFQPRDVLDVSFGPATGLLAAREVFGSSVAAGDSGAAGDNAGFARETAVLLGHPRMRQRATELLGATTTTRFRQDVPPAAASGRAYDLVVAQHQLFQPGRLADELVASHATQLARLLRPGGVLVLVERGDPVGFEAVALAREHLLRPKFAFDVIGPCTHRARCPLQAGLGARMHAKSAGGSQNWCRFQQQVLRPKFVLELKKGQYLAQPWTPGTQRRGAGGKDLQGTGRPFGNNFESASFSWVAMRAGGKVQQGAGASVDATGANAGADAVGSDADAGAGAATTKGDRILKTPMKRHGHVTMEVCAASGSVEHITVPKSQGKQAYHDARKAREADIWTLGAKVRQPRGGLRGELEPALTAAEIRQLPVSTDWWSPRTNPHHKFSSHQARISFENGEDHDDSFVGAMRDAKVDKRAIKW